MKKALCIILVILILISCIGIYFIRNMMSWSKPEGEASDSTIVDTANGKLQGKLNGGVYSFLGVQYAVGEKLFQKAEKVENWEGVKTAFEYGTASNQSGTFGSLGSLITGNSYGNNCQNLNVWTPALDGEKRPVMVWLHGGGFATGTANSYNGESLAGKQDVVVVGVNHRLNMLGHLDLSEYGDEYKDSANIGIDDIIMALEWIQENIESFGGDPDNVTVFGQSGGGAKVLALMTAPDAAGLFHKAIIQSGATETVGVKFTTKEASLDLTESVLDKLGIDRDNIDKINEISYNDLMSAGSEALSEVAEKHQIPGSFGGYGMEWEPVVDGRYIVDHPVTEDGFADVAHSLDIPVLIGSNINEWSRFVSSEQVEVTDEIKSAFVEAYPNENPEDARYFDTLIRMPMLKIMTAKADAGGANVYSYMFSYNNAAHGAEIPYVFAEGEGEMYDLMSSIWANFARSGVPSAEGLPEWEPYTGEGGACMIIDEVSYLDHHHDDYLIKLIKPGFDY